MARKRNRERPTLTECRELRTIRDKQQVEINQLRVKLAEVERIAGEDVRLAIFLKEAAIEANGLLHSIVDECRYNSVLTNKIRTFLGRHNEVKALPSRIQAFFANDRKAQDSLALAS